MGVLLDSFNRSATDVGNVSIGRAAGVANWVKRVVSGTPSEALTALHERGIAADKSLYEDTVKGGGGGWGWGLAYDIAQRAPEEIAQYLTGMKAVQGIAATSRFVRSVYLARQLAGRGAEAARLTGLAESAVDPTVKAALQGHAAKLTKEAGDIAKNLAGRKSVDALRAAGLSGADAEAAVSNSAGAASAAAPGAVPAVKLGLAGTIKAHPFQTAATLAAAGAAAYEVGKNAFGDKTPKTDATPTPDQSTDQPPQPTGYQGAPQKSTPATYEDLIQTALTKAGLTSQIPAPGTYDSLTGIRGTNAAAQAEQALVGTHEATAKYWQQQQDKQWNQANLENAQRLQGVQIGTRAYGAQQSAQGLAAGASMKGAVTPRDQFQGEQAMYLSRASNLNKAILAAQKDGTSPAKVRELQLQEADLHVAHATRLQQAHAASQIEPVGLDGGAQ